jgi:hypothetical protein
VLFLLPSVIRVIDNYINLSEILQQSATLLICVGEKCRPHTISWMPFTEIAHVITVTKYFPTFMLLRHFEFFVTVHGTFALHYYHSKNQSMLCHKKKKKQTFLAFSMVYNK